MPLIGYARVSTGEQTLDGQVAELRAAGCISVHRETASGGDRARPVLAQVVAGFGPGDVLCVVRLDRLARSLSHLLQVIEGLEARGAHFRSLRDPVDTTSPQGTFTLQVLGAAAELERALIRDRTKAGLAQARAEGRVGGNPGLKAGDPLMRRKLAAARDAARMEKLASEAQDWVPIVRRTRPDLPWAEVVRLVNARLPEARWSVPRLRRAVGRYVSEGLLSETVLGRAPRKPGEDRQVQIVAAMLGADPELSLRQIAARLEGLRERTPRGGTVWQVSSVRGLVERARAR
jgi:DNA invertase Pin-like site-specific DNA recombinase